MKSDLFNYFSQSVAFLLSVFKKGMFPSSFNAQACFFPNGVAFPGIKNFHEFNHKAAAFFFNTQVRKQRVENINQIVSCTNPFPYGILVLFKNGYRTIKSFFNESNGIWHHIETGKSGGEHGSSCGRSFICILKTAKVSVTIKKSSQPFKKVSVWGKSSWNAKRLDFGKRRFFTFRYFANKFFSCISSLFSSLINILIKKVKLFVLNHGKGLNFFNKKWNFIGTESPAVNFFSFFSFIMVNVSTKMKFKKIRSFFMTNGYFNYLNSIWTQRDASFSVEKSCKINHSFLFLTSYIVTGNDTHLQRLNPVTQG